MNAFEQGLGRYLNPDQLARIRSLRVGIAGAGGLGSNCALMLVRSGFRDLRVIDCDTVDASNLNRQFYFLHQVGRPKVQALRENLLAVNPNLRLDARHAEIAPHNAAEVFADCDVVVEALDQAQAKRMLVEAYLATGTFLVGASGLSGYGNADRIRTHTIKDTFRLVGDLSTEACPETPPLSPCVTLAAAKQADLVLEYALTRPL